MQKSFFDHTWDIPLTKIISAVGEANIPSADFDKLSRETNEQNIDWAFELTSFATTYDIELKGVIEVAAIVAEEIMTEMNSQGTDIRPSLTSDDLSKRQNVAKNLLYYGIKKVGGKHALRSLHIGASIHASMRWDKQRKFKMNDYYDFQHATSALGYCDAFLTEKPLHVLVTRPQASLHELNGCTVISDLSEAAEFCRTFS